MEKELNAYLGKLEKYLKPVAVSERIDIINEIKSEMQELQGNGMSAEEIIERLGDPKKLAKAYLGDILVKKRGFSLNRFLIACAFFSVVGFSGMIVIPTLAVIAPVFVVCGAICPVIGAVKFLDRILGLGLPYMENVGIFMGASVPINPAAEFLLILFVGVLLFAAGVGAWKLLLFYCRKVRRPAKKLSA